MDPQQNVIYYDKTHDWNLYIPLLFTHNRLYNYKLHCLLIDLQKIWYYSLEIFKDNDFCYKFNKNFLFWNNNPINKFLICGNIISYRYKYINNTEYIIFKIDDNSFNNNNNNKNNGQKLYLPKFIINRNLLTSYMDEDLQKLKNIYIEVSEIDFFNDTIRIDKIVKYNFDLLEQIQFWKLAINDKLCFQDYIWIIEKTSNTSENNNNDTGTDTDNKCNNSSISQQHIFIESLNNNIIKRNLEILSPYLDPEDVSSSNDISLISELEKSSQNVQEQDNEDSSFINISTEGLIEFSKLDNNINSGSSSDANKRKTDYKNSNDTNSYNINNRMTMKMLNYSFLSTLYNYHLLVPTAQNISIVDLYKFNGLNDMLEQYILSQKQIKEAGRGNSEISANLLKSTLFQNILSKYETMGLLSLFNNVNNCNLKPFLQLLSFIDSKCQTWLRLHIKINAINFEIICHSFRGIIPKLDVETILSLFKIVLNNLTLSDPRINTWYFELDQNMTNHKYALIHFILKNS